jgi:hypothetical protein
MNHSRRILIYVNRRKHLRTISLVANRLAEDNAVFVLTGFELGTADAKLDRKVDAIKKPEKMLFLGGSTAKYFYKFPVLLIKKIVLFSKALYFNKRGQINLDIFETVRCGDRLLSEYDYFKTLVGKNRIDRIIIPDDRSTKFLPLLKLANDKNISTFIISHGLTAGKESLGKSKAKKNRFDADQENLLLKALPTQFIRIDDHLKTSFYTPEWMLALSHYKMLPENPWVMGGGLSSYVIAANHEMKNRLVKNGCRADKIIVTGHPEYDVLFRSVSCKKEMLSTLYSKYAIGNRKIVLIALPQFGEHGMMPWDEHFREMRFLASVLDRLDAEILVSLHPRMDREQYQFLREDFRFVLLEESLSEVLPVADIFLASYSSTIQWSIMCNILTVNFDFYNLNYTRYSWMKGLVSIKKRDELFDCLMTLLKDEKYSKEIRKRVKFDSYKLLPFEGNSVEMIAGAICN